jgi:hypothetical protein
MRVPEASPEFLPETQDTNMLEDFSFHTHHPHVLSELTVVAPNNATQPARRDSPPPRYGHAAVVLENGRYVMILGGWRRKNSESHNDIWIFDTLRLRWFEPTLAEPLTLQRGGHSATLLANNRIVIFGGQNRNRIFNDVVLLDVSFTAEDVCVIRSSRPTIASMPPAKRSQHMAFSLGNKVYVMCGHDGFGRMFDDFWVLDCVEGEWQPLQASGTMPPPTGAASCVVVGRQVIMFGGRQYPNSFTNALYVLDVDSLVWRTLETTGPVPCPRAAHSCVLLGSQPYASATDIETLDFTSMVPQQIGSESDLRPCATASDVLPLGAGRRLLVFGGSNGDNRLSDLHLLELETLTWYVPSVCGSKPGPHSVHTACAVGEDGARVVVFGGFDGDECFGDLYMLSAEYICR